MTKNDLQVKKQRFGILLVTLLILYVGTGLLDYTGRLLHPRFAAGLSILLLAQVLVVAVMSVRSRWRWAGVTIQLLAAGTIVGQLIASFVQHAAMLLAADMMTGICLGYAIVVVLDHLMRARRADSDTINAAICVFLLLGVFWAVLYSAISRLEPGAFLLSSGATPSMDLGAGSVTALYYSVVTLTTLGYGDVTPVTTAARMMAALEAIVGQVYLVVLVARLVGLNVAQSMPQDRN